MSELKSMTSEHPCYRDMIIEALSALNTGKGSSKQKITKFIASQYLVAPDTKVVNRHVANALKKGVEGGTFQQIKGTGATGTFKLGKVSNDKKKTARKTAKLKVVVPRTSATTTAKSATTKSSKMKRPLLTNDLTSLTPIPDVKTNSELADCHKNITIPTLNATYNVDESSSDLSSLELNIGKAETKLDDLLSEEETKDKPTTSKPKQTAPKKDTSKSVTRRPLKGKQAVEGNTKVQSKTKDAKKPATKKKVIAKKTPVKKAPARNKGKAK